MSANVLDSRRIRKDFPCLSQLVYGKPLVYLDNAATALKPTAVIDEITRYYENVSANVHRGTHYLSEQATARFNEARAYIAQFFGAETNQVVFTRSTTEAINLVANCFSKIQLKPNDEIILTEMEHHSNIVPWYLVAKEKGLSLKVAPILGDGSLDLQAFEKLFNKRTKLCAFAHASNAVGTVNPIDQMTAIAKRHGVAVLIDGAQGAHHVPINMRTLGADFYCFSGHKAYGPTGIGVLLAKPEWLDQFPPYQGGGDMIASVSFDQIIFAKPPQKFEAGTPHIAGVLGLKKALEYIATIGFDAIHQHEQELHNYAMSKLKDMPKVRIIGNAATKVSLISFVVEGVHPHDISSIFDREGVAIRAGHLCAQPLLTRFSVSALARASFALYNTKEELDRFLAAFARVFEVFRL